MRTTALAIAVVISIAVPAATARPPLTAPDLTVGRNLQTYASVTLGQAAPEPGVEITLTSDDPSRLLLSKTPDKSGSASISVTVRPKTFESPEFCVQGLAAGGVVTYTVTAAGIGSAKGKVTLAPSAIVIVGPLKLPSFPSTPRSEASKITLVSAALDSSRKVDQEQPVAGGLQLEVAINNSSPDVGKLAASKLTLVGGSSTAVTYFLPAAAGNTTLTPVQPAGFTPPAEYATVIAAVAKPGLAIVGDVYLGKDLQMTGTLCLGEAAPPGGLKVTLTSTDGSKLVLSAREDQLGSASLILTVPEGQFSAPYYLQGLGDSGEVLYSATAPGFRSRTARVGLTPSGVIVAYSHYGPPDEAVVLRKNSLEDSREFFVSLSDPKQHEVYVSVWTVHLDPESGRAADITVQPLRHGVTVTAILKSSNPEIATIQSPVVIRPGHNHAVSKFSPLTRGKTVISVNTPSGFTTPKNATSVPATVND